MFRRSIRRLLGRPACQPFWERLYHFALSGMNIGIDGRVGTSGERWVIDLVARHLRLAHPGVVCDVGANVGEYTAELIARLGDGVKIYCFEPSEGAFAALSDRFAGRPGIELCNFGLSDREGTMVLYTNPVESGLASLYHRRLAHVGKELHPGEPVRLRRLEDFCRERGIARIGFLKLDVEGHELSVLRGGGRLLETNAIDVIQFEFGGCNIDSRTYFRDFFELLNPRYTLYRVLRAGLARIQTYRETFELFTTTNYLVVSRTVSLPVARSVVGRRTS